MTSPDDASTKPYRATGKVVGLVVRCAVTLGLLWLLAANVDLGAVGKTFAEASPGWIVATLVLAFTHNRCWRPAAGASSVASSASHCTFYCCCGSP